MISDYSIDIDLKLKPSFPQPLKINQYDKGFYVMVNLFDNGEPYIIPSTETAIIELSLPGGKGYIISGSSIKDISNNSFRFEINRNISLNSGEATFNVALVDKKTGTTIRKGSFKRYIRIESNSIDEGTVSENLAVSIIETLQSTVATATAKETSLKEAIKTGDLDNYAKKTYIASGYVAKETGKGLSTNDFTNAYKTVLDGLTTTISDAILESKKALYPVGSLYFNATREANPGTLLGFGTWERIAQGKTLIGVDTEDTDFNTAKKTGGSKTQTLSIAQLPQNLYLDASTNDGSSNKWVREEQGSNWCNKIAWHRNNASQESVSIMQPYITVYIWERTA